MTKQKAFGRTDSQARDEVQTVKFSKRYPLFD